MKTTQLWRGVRLVNTTGRRIHITWKVLPDGTRMALLMGEAPGARLSGAQELGWFSAIAAAAPAIFSMAKKVAPGLMAKAGDLAAKYLPGAAGNLLKGALAPAANAAQKAVASAGRAPLALPAAKIGPVAPMMMRQPIKAVRHLAPGAKTPAGYTKVTPVMKIEEGGFVD